MTLLSPKEAAERSQVRERSILDAIEAGALAHVRVGGKTRIDPRDLESWWERNKVKAWDSGFQNSDLRFQNNLAPREPTTTKASALLAGSAPSMHSQGAAPNHFTEGREERKEPLRGIADHFGTTPGQNRNGRSLPAAAVSPETDSLRSLRSSVGTVNPQRKDAMD